MMLAGHLPHLDRAPRRRPPTGRPRGRPRANFAGQTINDLRVVADSGKRTSTGHRLWVCECLRCGRYLEVRQNHLGEAVTCGCGRTAPRRKEWWLL